DHESRKAAPVIGPQGGAGFGRLADGGRVLYCCGWRAGVCRRTKVRKSRRTCLYYSHMALYPTGSRSDRAALLGNYCSLWHWLRTKDCRRFENFHGSPAVALWRLFPVCLGLSDMVGSVKCVYRMYPPRVGVSQRCCRSPSASHCADKKYSTRANE